MALLGPISSGTPNGGGPFLNWVVIVFVGSGLVRLWRKRLALGSAEVPPLRNVLWVTFIGLIMICFGIWGLMH